LTFGCRDGRTVLLSSYAEPPFRVGRVFPEAHGLHLILASSGPGIFGGDCLRQTIVVQSGAQVRLTSQSAMQVHPSRTGTLATLMSSYRVEGNGRLACEWDPMIPFQHAALEQRISIELAKAATLLWSDAFMAGREARGERWQFSRLSHDLRVSRAASLAYLERYCITPATDRPRRRWAAANACYFGTVLSVSASMNHDVARRLHDELAGQSSGVAAADLLDRDVLLTRLAAWEGSGFHHARAIATRVLQAHSGW
jgi:urease accessory protein UreH